ncbi:MAG: NUDIX domain-containing protein [Candidatus Taylorbacteria bacterium]|nr:NUDIX domain-containing protein [Candidatus Taylorbacteria bacterium]
MNKVTSDIQNHIISRLKNAKVLRYSELAPHVRVPNDLFNYHLQFLVKKGLLTKTDIGYSLAEKGVKYVADAHALSEEKILGLFKYNVITIVMRINKKKIEILNQLRKSNPSYGKVGVPGGMVRKGEKVEDAATRKLKVETGLKANFKIVGFERRLLYLKEELFSDMLFPIAYADEYEGEIVNTEFGDNMWVSIDEAIKNESIEFDSIKTIVDILKLIKNGKIDKAPFIYNEIVQRD